VSLIAILLSGCIEKHQGGAYVGSLKAIGKVVPLNEKFDFLLDGTNVDAKFKTSIMGEEQVLELVAHGDLLEREVYRVNESGISLIRALSEEYSPPLPLMKFPFNVGDKKEIWKGKMLVGTESLNCSAEIVSSESTVNLASRSVGAIQIDVNLAIDQGNESIPRKLSFWFVPDRGILRREFGTSVRTVKL
jgi:hypothetical protein